MDEQKAREWNAQHPSTPVSVFAAHFPGKYRQAADALRRVRRETPEDAPAVTDDSAASGPDETASEKTEAVGDSGDLFGGEAP
jgi:hypothetical protein